MIEAHGLTKRYGDKVVVSDLSFSISPGMVTGFLGPNGAGKSTTMRMILGLDRPTAGTVSINGKSYVDQPAPMGIAGALLDAKAVHTSRSAHDHLRALAATHGISSQRINDVIDLVGLTKVAGKRAGGFSLGMGQRLGIASALLADPDTIILDEPVNGLDPEGVRWVRQLLREQASRGKTVLLSSHLMSEMELTADHVLIIGRGRLIRDVSMAELRKSASAERVFVRTPTPELLRDALAGPGVAVSSTERHLLTIAGASAERIGQVAAGAGVVLYELTPQRETLEDIFMRLTHDAVEYHAGSTPTQEIAA